MERTMKIWNVDHYDVVETCMDADGNPVQAVVKCLRGESQMITIEQFIEQYRDADSIQWNYNHIGRYANREAALQWLTAKANEAHCLRQSLICLDAFEDSGYTDKIAKAQSEELEKDAEKWAGTAKAFYAFIDAEPSDPRTPEQIALDEWQADEQATRESVRP
jgi:hypothetical protein